MAKEENDKPKYGIQELADAVGSKANLVRIRLRRLGIKRGEGKIYGWNSKAELDEVIKQLASTSDKNKATPKEKKKQPVAKKVLKKAA